MSYNFLFNTILADFSFKLPYYITIDARRKTFKYIVWIHLFRIYFCRCRFHAPGKNKTSMV